MDSGTKQKISQVYDKMHVVLWSGLVALLIFFALYRLPRLRAFQLKELQVRNVVDLAAEEEAVCAKLAMGKGTPAHDAVLL